MPVRDFDKEINTDPREDPVAFKLFGRQWDCGDDVNGKRLLDNAALLDGDSLKDMREAVERIFEDVLDTTERETGRTIPDPDDDKAEIPETTSDFQEFMDLLDDPKTVIPLSMLMEVVGYLVEQYTDRPTVRPGSSPNGQGTAGRTSTAKRGARGSTSARSRQRTT